MLVNLIRQNKPSISQTAYPDRYVPFNLNDRGYYIPVKIGPLAYDVRHMIKERVNQNEYYVWFWHSPQRMQSL